MTEWGKQSWDWAERGTELSSYRSTITTGTNLANTFMTMASAANTIDNMNLSYGPFGVNSNAVVHTILVNSGLPPVSIDSSLPGTGAPWTPGGAVNLLAIFDPTKSYLPDEAGPDSTPARFYTNLQPVVYSPPSGFGGGLESFNWNTTGSYSGVSVFGGTSGRWVYGSATVDGVTRGSWYYQEAVATRIKPIIIDLAGNGLDLTSATSNGVQFDPFQTGHNRQTGWYHADDAMLTIDANGDGIVNGVSEISFLGFNPIAGSDMEALKVFDTNGNNHLDTGDSQFGSFRLWRDANYNGQSDAGELLSLASYGITVIELTANFGGGYRLEGNDIFGISTVHGANGVLLQAYDVGLRSTSRGVKIEADTFNWTLLESDNGETVAIPVYNYAANIDTSSFSINGILPDAFQLGTGNDVIGGQLYSAGRRLFIDAGEGDNTIYTTGEGGTLKAGSGSDSGYGGSGSDTYDLGAGNNLAWENYDSNDHYYIGDGYLKIEDNGGMDAVYIDANFNDIVLIKYQYENYIRIYQGSLLKIEFNVSIGDGLDFLVTRDRTLGAFEILDYSGAARSVPFGRDSKSELVSFGSDHIMCADSGIIA